MHLQNCNGWSKWHHLLYFLFWPCSVLGSILMIMGLYILLWGKSRDASATVPPAKEEEDKEKQIKS
uniref:Uncharacterized protein n=1 Tax=Aegilops tauschii subsp. strangulata TaxID=200361 RepID=A0A453QCR8_AEGTS